jgi:hypothetical protein
MRKGKDNTIQRLFINFIKRLGELTSLLNFAECSLGSEIIFSCCGVGNDVGLP